VAMAIAAALGTSLAQRDARLSRGDAWSRRRRRRRTAGEGARHVTSSRRTAAPHRLASHSLRSLRSRSLTRQDENFHIIYTNAKVDLTEWHQFPVGRTHFNDDAVRRTGEWAGLWRWAGWGEVWSRCRPCGAAVVMVVPLQCHRRRGHGRCCGVAKLIEGGAVIFDRRRGAS
jgi:hypothetical protein